MLRLNRLLSKNSNHHFIPKRTKTIKLNKPELFDIKYGSEITLYIKGFISTGEKPDNFNSWLQSHEKVVKDHRWNDMAKGWYWKCGDFQYPYPIVSGSHLLFSIYSKTKYLRLNPWTLTAGTALDVGLFSGRLLYQYYEAENNTFKYSNILAKDLVRLSNKYGKVRVVAHSLGCKLLLHSLEFVPQDHRPDIIHMCAPAFEEEEFSEILPIAAKNKTYIYYCENDIILSTVLQLIRGKNAVGAFGLKNSYKGVEPVDVTDHFKDFWLIHNQYSNELPNFIKKDNDTLKLDIPNIILPKYEIKK